MDLIGVQNFHDARAAGIEFDDVYMFRCRGMSATNQANQLIGNLGSTNYGMIWLVIETNPSSGRSWGAYDTNSNCQYVSELVQAIRN
jgi:hypothetical protein